MSNKYGPKIITDGLVLHLDAANRKSYPGSGTTWYDLSRYKNHGTLINSPTFDSGNGGSIVFDGSNDYIELVNRNTILEFQPLQPYSVFFWVYNLSSTAGAIISNMAPFNSYSGWDFWVNGDGKLASHLISSWSGNAIKVGINFNFSLYTNKWVYIGFTYNGTSPANATDSLNSIDFYLNGTITTGGKTNILAFGFNTTSETTTYASSQRVRIASRWASGGIWEQGTSPTTSNFAIYNRMLSASEIQQNFNATRGRFGL